MGDSRQECMSNFSHQRMKHDIEKYLDNESAALIAFLANDALPTFMTSLLISMVGLYMTQKYSAFSAGTFICNKITWQIKGDKHIKQLVPSVKIW